MEWVNNPVDYENQIEPRMCIGDCDLCFFYHCDRSYS